jgi:hypothetical protein
VSQLGVVHGRNHLLQPHFVARELTDGFHVPKGNPVRLPLRNRSPGKAEVIGKGGAASGLGFEPGLQIHAPSLGDIERRSQGLPNRKCDSIHLTMDADRRRRLLAYVKAHYGGPFGSIDRNKLMARTQLTKGRISQLFDEDQPFGERAARALAERLGLRLDYFERDELDIDLDPDTLDFALRYQRASRDQRAVLRSVQEAFAPVRDPSHEPELPGMSDFAALEANQPNRRKTDR